MLFLKASQSGIALVPEIIAAYVFGLLMVFIFSTAYHATTQPLAKHILRIFDHISIFLLIGGTYIPFVYLYADPQRAKWLLGIQWIIIGLGIVKKLFFTGKFELFSTLLYVGIGLMAIAGGEKLWNSMPKASLYLLIAGGLMYLVGVLFYRQKNFLYHHLVWHFFVLAAAILHFAAVYYAL